MKDRTPTKILENGAIRYGVYDETGKLLRYEYIRPEDEPTDEGTPLNSNTLLKQTTAEKLGLAADAFPDDALRVLADGKADLDPGTGQIEPGQLPSLVASFHGRTGEVVPQEGDYTPAQVGAAPNVHTHVPADMVALTGTDYSTSRVRGIAAGTADLTAGTSSLPSGTIYLVYE